MTMKRLQSFVDWIIAALTPASKSTEPEARKEPFSSMYHCEIEDYLNPYAPQNGERYRMYGRKCMTPGCDRVPGTAWSPHWCQPCNAARMERTRRNIGSAADELFMGKRNE